MKRAHLAIDSPQHDRPRGVAEDAAITWDRAISARGEIR